MTQCVVCIAWCTTQRTVSRELCTQNSREAQLGLLFLCCFPRRAAWHPLPFRELLGEGAAGGALGRSWSFVLLSSPSLTSFYSLAQGLPSLPPSEVNNAQMQLVDFSLGNRSQRLPSFVLSPKELPHHFRKVLRVKSVSTGGDFPSSAPSQLAWERKEVHRF